MDYFKEAGGIIGRMLIEKATLEMHCHLKEMEQRWRGYRSTLMLQEELDVKR